MIDQKADQDFFRTVESGDMDSMLFPPIAEPPDSVYCREAPDFMSQFSHLECRDSNSPLSYPPYWLVQRTVPM